MSLLHQSIVLVLNRHWQPIGTRTPADAFCQMATGVSSGLDISPEAIRPTTWSEWLALPIRDIDRSVSTVRGPVRMPVVIVAVNYDRVPRRRPAFNSRNLRERDGNRCQYTGRVLAPGEGSIDHVVPRSRGGPDSWENCVWADRSVNVRKGNRLPSEAGLRLLSKPVMPRELPVSVLIRNSHGVPEWRFFLAGA